MRRAVAAAGAALLLPVTPAAALPTPSPLPPTAGQAQIAKRQADGRVATLRQRIAAGEQRMRALTTTVTRADGAFDTQLRVVAAAKVAESLAAAALADSQRRYDSARGAMVQLAVAAYEGGSSTTAADLFTAPDPEAVLEAAAYRRLNSDFQTQLTAQLHDALAARHRAEADQQEALGAVSRQLDTLAALRTRAATTRGQALATLQALRADMRVAQRSQARADAALAAFLGSWARSDPGQASALNQRYQAIAQSVAGRRLPAGRGRWSAAIGQAAADRAIQWIGTPYAWAGGTATAPTRGVCTGDGAEHDCQVIGFDCSGLVLYAWGPYRSMKHYAATQYVQAGRLHPAVDRLLPGDLVFWSSDGTVAGIHHVAIYVGDGYVVQAPESGDIVRVTPLADVSPGYYGATRPLT